MYRLLFSPQAKKDAKKLAKSNLREKTETLLTIIQKDPFAYPPSFEKLSGKLKGFLSRRINKKHRLVYKVLEKDNIIKIIRMWTHYE